ncbi:uncharacterized protein OCT59_010495 [Rhizophagus irregularis]|nr:hypothetical protein OCT59_010495 [Rhizophagus irregularis]GBC29928.1 hypothetical protein GLOIN_2v1840244 [Rhizophagus irregularis DAOM 181602=DAOM 197198]
MNARKPGRPEAEMIKLTVVCFKKVSPNTIPKYGRSFWIRLQKKHIKKITIYKTDNIKEKICKEFNLNQGLKLYKVKSGKPIEVNGELNFTSIKSNMAKKNRRLYVGPDTHDIKDTVSSNNNDDDETFTNEVSNQPSDHVNGSPTTMIDRSHTLPGSNPYNSPNSTNNINAGTSINGDFNNQSRSGYTNELSVDAPAFPASDSSRNFIGSVNVNTGTSSNAFTIGNGPNDLNYASTSTIGNGLPSGSNSFYSTSTNEEFMNRNLDGSFVNNFLNGNVNNQSRSGYTNELSVGAGITTSRIPTFPFIGSVNTANTFTLNGFNGASTSTIGSVINSGHTNGLPSGTNSFYSNSTNEGLMNHNLNGSYGGTFTNGNVSNQSSRELSGGINRYTIDGTKYLSFRVDNIPESGDFIKIRDVIYELIPEDRFITDVGTCTNGGYNELLANINPPYNKNAATHFNGGFLDPFSNNNNNNENYQFQLVSSTSPLVDIPNDIDDNFIFNGNKYPFQKNFSG